MIVALALAASVVGASPEVTLMPPPIVERTPNLYRAPGPECGPIERKVLEDQKEQLRKLGRLPNGILQYAVLREVGGCAVPAPVGYHPPALPGAADNPPNAAPAAKREDAPSNRR